MSAPPSDSGGRGTDITPFLKFLFFLILIVIAYSGIFRFLMSLEGREYSWTTAVYWTMTVMSTLGFGDITFTTDLGRFFSILVLLSGIVFLLVMLPFTFIQHFYVPWTERLRQERIPRQLPPSTSGHVILVGVNALTTALATDLKRYGLHPVILCNDSQTTENLLDQGYKTVCGKHDNAATYRNLRLDQAAMLVAMDSDQRNTNVVYTAHATFPKAQVIARAEHQASIDILKLAGATRVYQFHELLGRALARRVLNPAKPSSTVGTFNELVIAEAPVMRTSLVGKTVLQTALRASTGVNIVGIWERGHFSLPNATTLLTENTVIVIAGTRAQIKALDAFLLANNPKQAEATEGVVVLGGGRVGQATAQALERQGIKAVVVDQEPIKGVLNAICGNAAELDVLEEAGIRTASSVVITTRDDDTNIYLTIYCRKLRPDIQIISRAFSERNVEVLHSAGADLVLSLATMISNTFINRLSPGRVMVLNESLNIFRIDMPPMLDGVKIINCGIREHTNCSIVAIGGGDHPLILNPPPNYSLKQGEELYLIGDSAAENAFHSRYAS